MDDRSNPGINDYAARLIKFKARQLCQRRGFSVSDERDIEQDLWVDLLVRLPRFDSGKSALNTFIARIVERRVISLIRYRLAEMRAPEREECSLNDPVLDADDRTVERHQTTPEASSTWQRLLDLERDVAEVRKRLSAADARAIAEALGRGGTINSIAEELGISRRTAARHLADIRTVFDDAGLRDYL